MDGKCNGLVAAHERGAQGARLAQPLLPIAPTPEGSPSAGTFGVSFTVVVERSGHSRVWRR